MKKLLVVLLSLMLILAFAACDKATEEPAEEASAEAITIALGEALPAIELGEGFTAMEVTEDHLANNATQMYRYGEGALDIVVYEDAKEGMTLEEFVASHNEAPKGCVEDKNIQGVDCKLLCRSMDVESGRFITKFYVFETEDSFVTLSYWFSTEEVQLADSNVYMWLPVLYSERELTEDEAADNGTVTAYTAGEGNYLADIVVLSWGCNSWTYEELLEYYGSEEYMYFTKEQFNAWAEDGFTLEEQNEFYQLQGQPVESAAESYNGIDMILNDYRSEREGEEYTNILITCIDGDKFVELKLTAPTAEWPAMGEAMAATLHTVAQAQ